MNEITEEKLKKYFEVSEKAFAMANEAENGSKEAADFLDMIARYLSDAKHFEEKGERVTAFAALNYAHGWLDAGARIGLFKVNDSTLFTVDD